MPTILIDNRELTIPAGQKLNGIEAARMLGIKIPHYCWHPGLSIVGSCRMCLIEVGSRDPKTGKITMQPKLVPACNAFVSDGLVLVTNSEKVAHARAMVEEGLLLRHPVDCPICDKAGECKLQDYYFKYGQDERRADIRPFTSRRRDLGDVTLFVDRCVMCSRCVRFANEVSGTNELMITGRGAHEEIDVVLGYPLNNKLSGNVVDLCPVGALGDKDFLYKQRVWYLKSHSSVCTGCATGCSIWVEENQDRIYRIRPRNNSCVNQWWICNDGRYDYPHVHDPRRITQPRAKLPLPNGRGTFDAPGPHPNPLPKGEGTIETIGLKGEVAAGGWGAADWTTLPGQLHERLAAAGRLAAVISPYLTVEEAYLLCKLIRGIDRKALLALGPVPAIGEDERFAQGFTISAEKCPNRRGVEAILAYFVQRVVTFEELLGELDAGQVQGVWVSGGYKTDWIGHSTASRFERLKVLVVQDLFPSPLMEKATYALPGAAYAERPGSYVNRHDRLQTASQAIRPPAGVRTEGSLLWELSGRKGLYSPRTILSEVAREILYFSVALGPVPETGVDLKSNLLADGQSPTKETC